MSCDFGDIDALVTVFPRKGQQELIANIIKAIQMLCEALPEVKPDERNSTKEGQPPR